MTDQTDASTADFDPTSVAAVFCDTCVLINYVQQEWEHDQTSALLESEGRDIVIGESVEEEFLAVTDRRKHVYPDFIDFLLDQEDELAEYTPSIDGPLQSNDYGHIESLKMEMASADRSEALRRLRRFSRRIESKVQQVLEDIVDEVVMTATPFTLGLALSEVIPNEADCTVVEEAAGWTRDGGSGVFTTQDSSDLLELVMEINEVLEAELSADATLIIVSPAVFEAATSRA